MFIVFEGIDGCGKTTQIMKLAEHLNSLSKYGHILLTREAYKDRKIRDILKQEENNDKPRILTELFIKDRIEHASELINPMLEKNVIIICDRYKYSTVCFQSAQGQDMHSLIEMNSNLPIPDYVFILDIPSEIAFGRINKRKNTSNSEQNKFEEDISFLEKVRQNYLKMPGIFSNERIILLDGTKTIDAISEEIRNRFPSI